MKLDPASPELQSLLHAASAATITLYREDGEAITSPVWFRVDGGSIEIVVAATDRKLAHLRRDPRCIFLVFEAVPPFRGVEVRGQVTLAPDDGSTSRLAIATRCLGVERGRAYADLAHRTPGFRLRLPMGEARAWDLADKIS